MTRCPRPLLRCSCHMASRYSTAPVTNCCRLVLLSVPSSMQFPALLVRTGDTNSFFSQFTPLLWSAFYGRLDVTRLLVESKADVAAKDWCFSPPPSHHLFLTMSFAAMAELHSITPSINTKPTLLQTCAASALLSDAPHLAAVARINCPNNGLLVRFPSFVRDAG